MKPETNSLYQTDALGLLERFDSGQFTLAYVDPPWATGELSEATLRDYRRFISRLVQQCWRVLNERGTLYFHAPPVSHTDFRLILNQTFGRPPSSVIVWKYNARMARGGIPDSHEEILRYMKTPQAVYNVVRMPPSASQYRLSDDAGPYRLVDLTTSAARPALRFALGGKQPPAGRSWRFTQERMRQYEMDGRIVFREDGMPRFKQYFGEALGNDLGSVWDDIPPLRPTERFYPSEKPSELCDRIIRQATNEGDWVLDPLCGSGRVLAQSQRLSRRWVGCDNAPEAIEASRKLFAATFGPASSPLKLVADAIVQTHAQVGTEYRDIFLDIPELDAARQRLATFVALTASVKTELATGGQSDEEVIAALLDLVPRVKWLIPDNARKEAASALGNLLPTFSQLETDSREFLIAAFTILQMLPDGMDAAVVSVSAWKAVENELNQKLLVPFRDWANRANTLAVAIANDIDPTSNGWECGALAKYLKTAQLPPLGTTRGILNKCATSKKTIQNSPSLRALRDYIQNSLADPTFLLSSKGMLTLFSQERINRHRNGAAHTTAFSKVRARESFDFVIQALPQMLDGLRPTTGK